MTKQEAFKSRIRERMEKTGDRYIAARQQQIQQTTVTPTGRKWVAPPEMNDGRIREATGRGWDEWCDLIEASPHHDRGHTAIATYVREELEVDPWWAQAVTVGFERITGLRLPHQMADGTFTANKSMTVSADAESVRQLFLSADDGTSVFPGHTAELRSNPTAKTIRIGLGEGLASFSFVARPDGKTTVTVAHEKLPTFDAVERWKFYWSDWLQALHEASD